MSLIAVIFFCLFLIQPVSAANGKDGDIDAMLGAAERVFQSMMKNDYPAIWTGLTASSRSDIIKNVRKAIAKSGREEEEARIEADFAKGGATAQAYWSAYLAEFDPKTVLNESQWSLGEVNRDSAEILIRYRKSEHDAHLKMYREDGAWKVGLEESFASRRQ